MTTKTTGWKTAPLGELVKFASGGTPDREAAHFWNGDIPWLSAKDLKKFRLNDSIEKVTREGANNGTRLVEAENVLILVRGMTLLKDVPVGVTERVVAFNQDLKALIPKGEVDGHYLGFYLVANKSRLLALVDRAGHGAGRLPSDLLQSFEIELPGLQEQRKIADTLLTWERAIEGAEKLIAAKSRLKRGLARQLLTGRKRFSKFDGQKWKRVRLNEICEINRRTLSERTDPAYEFFYLDISSVSKGSVAPPASKIRFKDAPSRARRIVRKNDILMSTVRPTLQAFARFTGEDDDVIASTGFAVITAKREVDIAFVYHSLFSDDTAQQINALIAGSNYPTVTPSQAGSLKLPLPPIDEQRRIAAALNTCDREFDLLRQQLAAFKRQKQGLMQKLLTG